MTTDQILQLARAYGAQKGIKLATVSTYAANDGKLFDRFSRGVAGCTIRRAQHLISWFDRNWPVDLEWPPAIPRPSNKGIAA